ncbi:hypothetical protein GCM10010124_14100 [Pilimelia terevasa]|uniref:AB hydrolase-1 domain-containing protein n=2 Tax=Pilimelia terevasa TaxID=53372 RepID=A0A8J3FGM9_9ACTN|nr:hypothetical protein GCM10010124_14100 [Pilimelia terevasa]
MGSSDRVPTRHTGKDSVRDPARSTRRGHRARPHVLVGHSFGGLLAANAETYPAEVKGLVLVDPSLPHQVDLYDAILERERAAARAADEQNPALMRVWSAVLVHRNGSHRWL